VISMASLQLISISQLRIERSGIPKRCHCRRLIGVVKSS
jgi:hypothetical protein